MSTAPLKGDGRGIYRIQIVGNSGVGKSTVAAQLSEILGIPYISLDPLFWQPGWGTIPKEEFQAKVQKILDEAERGWIVDGQYLNHLGGLIDSQATDRIWLDPPFVLYFLRLCYRTLLRLLSFQPPCATGCEDTWSDVFTIGEKSIVYWCWSQHNVVQVLYAAKFAEGADGRRRIGGWGAELKSWLEDVQQMARAA